MKRILLFFSFATLLFTLLSTSPAFADGSHARIVRLSFIQGDVRFAPAFHENSLTDLNVSWQVAQLNLPIRQGNVLSTGNGRAEVEFENGAMAFLGANTILEFYDLSLNDGDRITRLVLRQGSASFHESAHAQDYFSVTGGDFSVAVDGHATFRFDNFDDGSMLNVQSGRVSVLQDEKSTPLEKGQSLTVRAQDRGNLVIGRAEPSDEFDRWVAGRVQNEEVVNSQVATTGSYPNYVAGYSDLYTYGSWMNVGGFNCWRPFGVGLGWSPFDYGNWYFDQGGLGWSFVGSSPWGWLPYHYGGWVFSPGYGWLWNPNGLFTGRPQPYHPVTGVFVHSGNTLALVPMHPGDKPGKTPLNLTQGAYPIQAGVVGKSMVATNNEKWTVQKTPQVAGFTTGATIPTRVIRTISSPSLSTQTGSFGRRSSIVYDSNEHRFVNSGAVISAQAKAGQPTGVSNELKAGSNGTSNPALNRAAITPHATIQPSAARASSLPPRPTVTPAPARATGGSSSASSWGGSSGRSSGGAMPSSSVGSTSSSAPGSSHPSSTGGGRPH